MKQRCKVLCVLGVWIIIPTLLSMSGKQQESLRLNGVWTFENAEYLEKESMQNEYKLKYAIEDVKDLYALESCYPDLVKNISFFGEIATVECLYVKYYGKYVQSEVETSAGKEIHLKVGSPEEIDLEYDPGIVLNAPGLNYLVRRIDEETISITIEHSCYENSEKKYGAVRCRLRKL